MTPTHGEDAARVQTEPGTTEAPGAGSGPPPGGGAVVDGVMTGLRFLVDGTAGSVEEVAEGARVGAEVGSGALALPSPSGNGGTA